MDTIKYAIRSTGFAVKGAIMGSTAPDVVRGRLQEAFVPISDDLCRSCPNPCDEDHGEYPARFDVDMVADLLGTFKPYGRQVVISTGASDWEREVTDTKNSLAQLVRDVHDNLAKEYLRRPTIHDTSGIYEKAQTFRLSILNGSHVTTSDEKNVQSVLIFPDYKVVDVPESKEGAEALWRAALDPALERVGKVEPLAKSHLIPYSCVILLCSHRRRDTRCSVTAPKLEAELIKYLEHEGWEAHTKMDEPHGSALEDISGTPRERETTFANQMQSTLAATAEHNKRVLILRCSHTGGHKFAGNMIIHTPQDGGSSVWYGRVSPHEVPAVVKSTIIGGKVLPSLLRGGQNITRPAGKGLLDW